MTEPIKIPMSTDMPTQPGTYFVQYFPVMEPTKILVTRRHGELYVTGFTSLFDLASNYVEIRFSPSVEFITNQA